MRGKRRRLWERVKTLLILALSCSAVYLASRIFFPGQLGGLFARPAPVDPAQPGTALLSSQTLRPAALAVTRSDGRYGLLYHQDDQEAITQASSLLAQALANAAKPRAVTRQAWLQALAEPGLFCQYLAPMPLDALSRWLSGQEEPDLAQVWSQRLCITERKLYFQGEGETYYACDLSCDLAPALGQMAEQFSANGAHFAGESDKYPTLRADSLILSQAPRLPQLLVEDPVPLSSDPAQPAEALSSLLQTLSFHPQTNPLYPVTGGWAITDGGETLRIDPKGQLTYRRSDRTAQRFPAEESALDATRALAEATVGALGGDARLYLQQVRHSGALTVITYGYAYRGAAIQTGEEGWCAQFIVQDGCVDSFTLIPRRYTAREGADALLLPQEQAAAALDADRQSLELLYEDLVGQSQELTPFWAVRAEGR